MNGALVNSEVGNSWLVVYVTYNMQYLTTYTHRENGMQIISWYLHWIVFLVSVVIILIN